MDAVEELLIYRYASADRPCNAFGVTKRSAFTMERRTIKSIEGVNEVVFDEAKEESMEAMIRPSRRLAYCRPLSSFVYRQS